MKIDKNVFLRQLVLFSKRIKNPIEREKKNVE
jgi:hypothetical protein